MNEETRPSRWKYIVLWLVLLAGGFAGWLAILITGTDKARCWRALLINFTYFLPLAGGLVTWSAVVVASNGSWPGKSERLTWLGFGFLLPSILILIALWIGSPHWAPWYGKKLHQGLWLDNTWLFLRDLVGLLIFWGFALWYLRRRKKGRKKSLLQATLLAIIYASVFTVLGFDLIMALNPEWYSAIFGAYFFISGLYIAICFWSLIAAMRPQTSPDVRHDLGKLILTFGIMTTYFFFIQLLTIWYENLPNETSFLITRKNFLDWFVVSWVIIGVVYLGPLIMLLTRKAKRSRYALGIISAILLMGLWLERWWLITPTFARVELGWVELTTTAAVLGALGLGVQLVRDRIPRLPPEDTANED